jgi:peptidoglycan hydrolase CwlO-like protein
MADLVQTGKKMKAAGKAQVSMGKKLDGLANQMRSVAKILKTDGKFDKSLIKIKDGINSTSNLLAPVETTLRALAGILRAVTVPSINPNTRTIDIPVVGRVTIVTGITISSTNPLSNVANKVDSVANDISNVRNALNTIANAMNDLHNELPKIQKGVENGADEAENAGDLITQSGDIMQEAGVLISS